MTKFLMTDRKVELVEPFNAFDRCQSVNIIQVLTGVVEGLYLKLLHSKISMSHDQLKKNRYYSSTKDRLRADEFRNFNPVRALRHVRNFWPIFMLFILTYLVCNLKVHQLIAHMPSSDSSWGL